MCARVALCAAGAALCSGTTVHGEWIGGAFVTNPSWNAAATAAIGQQATVFRLMLAADGVGDVPFAIDLPQIGTINGELLYQDVFGTDRPPTQLQLDTIPSLRWDTYFSWGNLIQPVDLRLEDVTFSPTGVFSSAGGWKSNIATAEGLAAATVRAPGTPDSNGDIAVPAFLDDRFLYTFAGQFTVLGVDYHEATPIMDGGFIHSRFFSGTAVMSTLVGAQGGSLDQRSIQVVPAPSGAAVFVAGCVVGAGRRRRRV